MPLPDLRMAPNVDTFGVHPVMLVAVLIAYVQAASLGADVVYLSSGRDGVHSPKSLHYVGLAVDMDVPEWSEGHFLKWAERVAYRLPVSYDVVPEATHLHIEYQPKKIP